MQVSQLVTSDSRTGGHNICYVPIALTYPPQHLVEHVHAISGQLCLAFWLQLKSSPGKVCIMAERRQIMQEEEVAAEHSYAQAEPTL